MMRYVKVIDGEEIELTPDEVVLFLSQSAGEPNRGMQWAAVRAERNQRLTASDWTQVSDAPVDQVAWASYRQALRDLPATISDPYSFSWPTPPADNGSVT